MYLNLRNRLFVFLFSSFLSQQLWGITALEKAEATFSEAILALDAAIGKELQNAGGENVYADIDFIFYAAPQFKHLLLDIFSIENEFKALEETYNKYSEIRAKQKKRRKKASALIDQLDDPKLHMHAVPVFRYWLRSDLERTPFKQDLAYRIYADRFDILTVEKGKALKEVYMCLLLDMSFYFSSVYMGIVEGIEFALKLNFEITGNLVDSTMEEVAMLGSGGANVDQFLKSLAGDDFILDLGIPALDDVSWAGSPPLEEELVRDGMPFDWSLTLKDLEPLDPNKIDELGGLAQEI